MCESDSKSIQVNQAGVTRCLEGVPARHCWHIQSKPRWVDRLLTTGQFSDINTKDQQPTDGTGPVAHPEPILPEDVVPSTQPELDDELPDPQQPDTYQREQSSELERNPVTNKLSRVTKLQVRKKPCDLQCEHVCYSEFYLCF